MRVAEREASKPKTADLDLSRLRESIKPKTIVVGGLHLDDFHSIREEYRAEGYVMVVFEMEEDGYHWRARFVLNEGRFV